MPYTTQGYMTGADMADMAELYDWNCGNDEPNEECEAKGCDIPPGHTECRRCGAEVIEDETPCRRDEHGQCRDVGRVPHACA